MTTVSISDFQKNISQVFNWEDDQNVIWVTSHGKTKGFIVKKEEYERLQQLQDYLETWMISLIEPWDEDYNEAITAHKTNKEAEKKWEGYIDADEFMRTL